MFEAHVIVLPDYGPAIIEHCLIGAGIPENAKIGRGFDISKGKWSLYTVKHWWFKYQWLLYCGWLKLVFESLGNSSDSQRNFLILSRKLCYVYSLELPQHGDAYEYTQYTIWVHSVYHYFYRRSKKKTSLNYALLPPDLALWLTLVQLNPAIPCLCKQCRSRSVGF